MPETQKQILLHTFISVGSIQNAQKNTFSVKGSSRQEVFVGERGFWKVAFGAFMNYIPIPGRLRARRLETGSP